MSYRITPLHNVIIARPVKDPEKIGEIFLAKGSPEAKMRFEAEGSRVMEVLAVGPGRVDEKRTTDFAQPVRLPMPCKVGDVVIADKCFFFRLPGGGNTERFAVVPDYAVVAVLEPGKEGLGLELADGRVVMGVEIPTEVLE